MANFDPRMDPTVEMDGSDLFSWGLSQSIYTKIYTVLPKTAFKYFFSLKVPSKISVG